MSKASDSEYPRPLTTAEKMCEFIERWYLVRNLDNNQSPKKTHVPDPRVDRLATLCHCEDHQYEEAQVVTKHWSAIPLDYYPMCDTCSTLVEQLIAGSLE